MEIWRHPDGRDAGIAAISSALLPHVEAIVAQNVDMYPSNEFKVGICNSKLVENRDILCGLLSADPRGCFGQEDLVGGLASAMEWSSKLRNLVEAARRTPANTDKSDSEIIGLVAYRMRIMLAHLRIKFESGASAPELTECFEKLKDAKPQRKRRENKFMKRPNPFVYFRDDAKPRDESDDDDTPTLVATYFDGKACMAKKLFSDGTVTNADMYTKGPQGFAVAHWLEDQSHYTLEVPNSCVVGTELKAYIPPGPEPKKRSAKMMKRPATKRPETEDDICEDVGDTEDEDDQHEDWAEDDDVDEKDNAEGELAKDEEKDEDKDEAARKIHGAKEKKFEKNAGSKTKVKDGVGSKRSRKRPKIEAKTEPLVSPMLVKVTPGHDFAMTITVCSKGMDKAQIFEIKANALHETDETPRSLCEKIAETLKPHADRLSPLVKTHLGLDELRLLARETRDWVLGW